MTFALYGDYWRQEIAESNRQDCRFAQPDYREAYGFRRVQTCRNCRNLAETTIISYCKRFETLPGIKDKVWPLDDMVCDFWSVPDAPRDTAKQNEWAKAVYERDDYTCQSCGLRGCFPSTNFVEQGGRTLTVFDPGIQLQAHHIKPYALYPKLAWDIDNGITLCDKCHHEAHEHRIDIIKGGIIDRRGNYGS